MSTLLDDLSIAIPYELRGAADAIAPRAVDRQVFRAPDGSPWRYRGVSAFPLFDRFARGDDIAGWLARFPGYNLVRVWPYVPVSGWGDRAWDAPSNDVIVAGIRACGERGFCVECTLLTDDDPARIPWAQRLVDDLAAAALPNLLIEIGNEPLTNKAIDCEALRAACDAAPYLYASGIYEDESRCFGRYGTAHTPRTADWARRGHDLMEFFTGAGPQTEHTPYRFPWVGDEPIRPDEIGDPIDVKRRDYRAYGGVCALLGAGATFHFEGGKFLEPPTGDEALCAAEMLTGLLAFPEDAPLGPYTRIPEEGADPTFSRTYTVGPWMVRVRPPEPAPPVGWRALDAEGILAVDARR